MKKKLRITFNAPVVLSLVAISFLATLLRGCKKSCVFGK